MREESWKESTTYKNLMLIKAGERVRVDGERTAYIAQCVSDRFVVCTKPFNLRHTVLYFVIDKDRDIRGPDNDVFCMGYETKEQCIDRLKDLNKGIIGVSLRRALPVFDCYRGEGEWVIE